MLTRHNEAVGIIHAIWYIMSFYVIILSIIIFGYWRILVVIRRQARLMAGHSAARLVRHPEDCPLRRFPFPNPNHSH